MAKRIEKLRTSAEILNNSDLFNTVGKINEIIDWIDAHNDSLKPEAIWTGTIPGTTGMTIQESKHCSKCNVPLGMSNPPSYTCWNSCPCHQPTQESKCCEKCRNSETTECVYKHNLDESNMKVTWPICPCHQPKASENYEQDFSHTHCFNSEEGPIDNPTHRKHLRCCICQKPNPRIKPPEPKATEECKHDAFDSDNKCWRCEKRRSKCKPPEPQVEDWEKDFREEHEISGNYIEEPIQDVINDIRSLLADKDVYWLNTMNLAIAKDLASQRSEIVKMLEGMRTLKNFDDHLPEGCSSCGHDDGLSDAIEAINKLK